ncbi:MAG TPA: hypothetical protein P5057_11410, partial [Acidobacteriota bacterium]|nr:hypothetical protein [Acidobacteriota bacterium]
MRLMVSRDLYVLGLGLLLEVNGRFLECRGKSLLCRGIGAAAFHLSRQKRIQSLEALSRVFPDLSSARREAICRRSFVSFWEDLFDLSPEWTAWSRLGSTSVTGLDHLESAMAKGRGTVLWESNAFGFRNHAKKALAAQGFRVVQIHLETHFGGLGSASLPPSHLQEKVLTPWYERLERCFADSFIYLPRRPSLAAIRRIEEALAENRIVCSAADGRWGYASMEQRFLGHPTSWFIGVLSLSRLHGVPDARHRLRALVLHHRQAELEEVGELLLFRHRPIGLGRCADLLHDVVVHLIHVTVLLLPPLDVRVAARGVERVDEIAHRLDVLAFSGLELGDPTRRTRVDLADAALLRIVADAGDGR